MSHFKNQAGKINLIRDPIYRDLIFTFLCVHACSWPKKTIPSENSYFYLQVEFIENLLQTHQRILILLCWFTHWCILPKSWTQPRYDSTNLHIDGVQVIKYILYCRKNLRKEVSPRWWRSVSAAVEKSSVCLTDLARQMFMSNVSTMGCRKYSLSASSLKCDKSTPWKQFWYLKHI
jgi:hypothetical protein